MPSKTVAHALALIAGLFVGACQSSPQPPAFPELTYRHLGSFKLDVAQVEIIDDYTPPLKPPYVEHLFPTSPAKAAARWASDRIVAVGTSKKMRFIIRDASVVETQLDVKEGMEGALTTDQAERYKARLDVVIEIVSEGRGTEARVEAKANRTRSVPEDATVNARQRLFHEMAENLMIDLNAELERNILAHLGRYVR